MSASGVLIDVHGLRKAYGGQPVLRGIDLRVEPGETLVIVGGSGEGKSVLLRHLAGLERPDAGTIAVNGLDLAAYLALPPDEKPFRMAMVFQSAALLNSLTVAENITLRLREHGRRSEAELARVVTTCLEQVDLAGAEGKLPADLSGGMRKRAAIARALAIEPHVIFHDEPTADLDPILTEQIGELINRIRHVYGATQVVVTHNLALASVIGSRVAVLQRGQIVDLLPADGLRRSAHPYTQAFVKAASLHV
jgi:phospholipid/cholesterol/gamma-HCH transport system ATP-binding protein